MDEKFCFFLRNFPGRRKGRKAGKRPSFLKKRSKKLLSTSAGTEFEWENSVLSDTDESFLLLFFKKEDSCLVPAKAGGTFDRGERRLSVLVFLRGRRGRRPAISCGSQL